MIIPQDFQDSMSKHFYDKTVERVGETLITEEDGATHTELSAITGTFEGNVRLTNFKKVQEQYGLDYAIDLTVTTMNDTMIEIDEVIQYSGITYKVTDVLPFDSHKMIVGVKWTQK